MAVYGNTEALLKEYRLKKHAIGKSLKGFRKFSALSQKEIFEELAFCIFTPGSKALNGNRAVAELKRKRLLFTGSKDSIAKALRGIVRFHNNKALYLTQARDFFKKGERFYIKDYILPDYPAETRQWFVANIKGLGYKEASHFLRNIGLGKDFAILDTHILKNLHRFGVIKNMPAGLSKKRYIEIESCMQKFSRYINVPLDSLDLLLWSHETGFIYK
jgi:N-glycosylase/DNA lyase